MILYQITVISQKSLENQVFSRDLNFLKIQYIALMEYYMENTIKKIIEASQMPDDKSAQCPF